MNSTILDRVEMNEEIKDQLRVEFDIENTEVNAGHLMRVCASC